MQWEDYRQSENVEDRRGSGGGDFAGLPGGRGGRSGGERELGRRIDTLNIVAPTIYGQLTWTLNGKDRWKFWRKSRPLQAIATR